MNSALSKWQSRCVVAMRVAVGWHLAYIGLWALLAIGGFSWSGPLRCSRWIFGSAIRAFAVSDAMPAADVVLAVGLLAAGVLLMFGAKVVWAAAFGVFFFALQYVANPPHFGHTGVSHVMFVDRNLVEVAMLAFLAARALAARKSPPVEAAAETEKAGESRLDRRDLIVGIGSTVALAGAGVVGKCLKNSPVVRITGPEVKPFDPKVDLSGLGHPMTAYGKIGNVRLSRLILGGNVIGGWAHARDMHYYDKVVKAYHTDERVFRTFRIAEAAGINTILTNPALMRVINRYWREEGGKIQFISDCGYPTGPIDGARVSVENGASLVYCHGFGSDVAASKGDWKHFRKYLDESRKLGVPVGIGAHNLTVVKLCVEHDCIPDFWMKTVHRIDYPTAMLKKCDNIFVDTPPEEVYETMAKRTEPWIAFKVLGAGIEHPKTAFPNVFANGADFACVGMYDYQIVEDVNIANEIFERGLPERKRPWHG